MEPNTSVYAAAYVCIQCGKTVYYNTPHTCGGSYVAPAISPPLCTAIFPSEAMELLKEIREYLKDLKTLLDLPVK